MLSRKHNHIRVSKNNYQAFLSLPDTTSINYRSYNLNPMKTTFKKLFKFVLFAPLLVAFQCDDELSVPDLVPNSYTVAITPQATFTLDDTVWISGTVSSTIFDNAANDSIFDPNPQLDTFAIYKLIEPAGEANAIDAIDAFELIFDEGQFSFIPSCQNANLEVLPQLNSDAGTYTYRLGLKALEAGDYVVSWRGATIQNAQRNVSIMENYRLDNGPNAIVFDSCGAITSTLFTESQLEYYFTVE